MIVVIIAGGSGTRLWPLSTPDYPKHLLNLINDKSLLRGTYERARLLSDHVYVISERSHDRIVAEQLPDLDSRRIIVEPGRRGTASCIVLALSHIRKHHEKSEPIVFMHADHHIRDQENFVQAVSTAAAAAKKHRKIVLLGLEPSRPATEFGYIERGTDGLGGGAHRVKRFKEKPDRKTAQMYLKTGRYLWNMGYFVAPLSVFESSMKQNAPHLHRSYQQLCAAKEIDRTYLKFKSEAIDTALMEKDNELLVVPGTFDWMDVGSYRDLHIAKEQDDNGNTFEGAVAIYRVTNTYVRNDTDVPVAVLGLDNIVVINTPRGLLVANKNYSQDVGDVSKSINGD